MRALVHNMHHPHIGPRDDFRDRVRFCDRCLFRVANPCLGSRFDARARFCSYACQRADDQDSGPELQVVGVQSLRKIQNR